MPMNRKLAAELGQETIQILEAGHYTTESGEIIELGELLRKAVTRTCSYPPDRELPMQAFGKRTTRIKVRNQTTLAAARKLVEAGHKTVALNFASAKNPGGGFLSGARAQEESLARSSGLYACLLGNEMYAFHQSHPNPMYTHYAIYSPGVPVFRDDDGTLLEKPYVCSFITCPAVNAKVVLGRAPNRGSEIRRAMEERILKVFAIAATQGHETLVLGAWGCGVFGNDPAEIAQLFNRALAGPFRGAFARTVFAVVDWSEERRIIGPFCGEFGVSPE